MLGMNQESVLVSQGRVRTELLKIETGGRGYDCPNIRGLQINQFVEIEVITDRSAG